MLNETINILNDLNLYGLKNSISNEIDYITNNNLSFLEGLNHFLKNEVKYREINREQIIDFKNLRFIENKENIIFVGSPGVGKTHLATAIGITAAQNRNSTYFINCNDLIANLKKANSENRFINRINHYAKYKVLVIDEVGFLPVDPEGANMLFQLINKRYERHSTIITTNKPFGKWHEIFNDVTLANAILDRLLHHSHIININGNSYRLKNKLKIDSESSETI